MKKAVDALHGLRERKKAQTREALIDAALDLFERQGYDATTVEDIADAAEVSPRTFFRYFDSKLGLVMARSSSAHDKLGPVLIARPASESPIEAMRQALLPGLAEQLADPGIRRELQVVLTTPTLRNLAREHFYEEEAELAAAFAIRLGVDEGDLRAHVLAGAVAAATWTVIDRWIAERGDVDRLRTMVDEAFALLAEGLEAPAKRPARRSQGRR